MLWIFRKAADLCILIGTGIALWRYFSVGGVASYSNQAVLFRDSDLRLPPGLAGNTGRICVMHFWDPDCTSCNENIYAHLNYLITICGGANSDFYSMRKPGTHGQRGGAANSDSRMSGAAGL